MSNGLPKRKKKKKYEIIENLCKFITVAYFWCFMFKILQKIKTLLKNQLQHHFWRLFQFFARLWTWCIKNKRQSPIWFNFQWFQCFFFFFFWGGLYFWIAPGPGPQAPSPRPQASGPRPQAPGSKEQTCWNIHLKIANLDNIMPGGGLNRGGATGGVLMAGES